MIRIIITALSVTFLCNVSPASGQSLVEVNRASSGILTAPAEITGIMGAFPEEIKFLLTQVQGKTEFIIRHMSFTEGTLKGQHVVIVQTGIGKVNAALSTILLIEHFHPKAIIFTGIAGALNPDLSPGDLVIGTNLAHHDYGTLTPDGTLRRPTRNPTTMEENPVYFPSDSTLVQAAQRAGQYLSLEKIKSPAGPRTPRLVAGTIVTGDVFVSSEIATRELRTQMHAEATEMEGAAVAQVSFQQGVPFLIIRSISDNAGSTANADIKDFYRIAAHNSANLVMAILEVQLKQKK